MNNFLLEKSTYYYYGLLSESEKKLYVKFMDAILNFRSRVKINESVTSEQINRIVKYVLNDRPDIFWLKRDYTVSSQNHMIVEITFNFLHSSSKVNMMCEEIVNSYLYKQLESRMRVAKTDFDKVLLLYEFIIKNTEYEINAISANDPRYEHVFTMDGVFLKHRAVCSGYSKAFQYFATKYNVWCTIVNGNTKRARHSWNLVNLNGDYYFIDSTWGDPVFSNTPNKDPNFVSYDYFCITTEQLTQSHEVYFDDKVPLCTARKYNYYLYFGMLDDYYSVENVAKRIISGIKNGKRNIVIRYTTDTEYKKAVSGLFDKSQVFDALEIASRYAGCDTSKIRYSVDENKREIKIVF